MSTIDELSRWAREAGKAFSGQPSPALPEWLCAATSERLAELGLIPRNEFEAQSKVLRRQADRIAELEQRIAELEAQSTD